MVVSQNALNELSDYQKWRGGRAEYTLFDYLSCVCTPDLFFAFGELLAPELTKHEGEYFISSRFDVATHALWCSKLGDPVEIQKVMNHVHISLLFQGRDVSAAIAVEAAASLATVWSRVFSSLGLVGTASGSDLETAEVTLHRRR